MKIQFEDLSYPRPANGSYTFYHAGTLIKENGDEFPFTIVEERDGNTGYVSHEITWVENAPDVNGDLTDKLIETLEDCYYDMEQEEVADFKRQRNIEDDRAYHGIGSKTITKFI